VYVYQIEDILDPANVPSTPGEIGTYLSSPSAVWEAPESLRDDISPCQVFDIAIDDRGLSSTGIYVAVRRVGVVILELDTAQLPATLTQREIIQTPAYPTAVHVRVNEDGSRHLVMSDYGGGIRIYGEED
jgi:hypothetical protein